MLIASLRHTAADLRWWQRIDRADRALGPVVEASLAMRAMDAIAQFMADGPCYVGVSWGKDSVAAAHLARRVDPAVPLIWFRADRVDNPDCPLVRDAFVAQFPDARVMEIAVPGDGDPDSWDVRTDARRITGLRAEESGDRAISARVHGVSTDRSCRPLLRWRNEQVFAYLAHHDLPVHPAYACSFGGSWPRTSLRVGCLGGDRGTRFGRDEWERRYYPESRPTGRAG